MCGVNGDDVDAVCREAISELLATHLRSRRSRHRPPRGHRVPAKGGPRINAHGAIDRDAVHFGWSADDQLYHPIFHLALHSEDFFERAAEMEFFSGNARRRKCRSAADELCGPP